jgi:predicted 2-oxoglutarate/Fe(II)-dependent dioxygenase YbiX
VCVYFFFSLLFLLQHVDGAGKVDGSVVVALPMDRWSSSTKSAHDDDSIDNPPSAVSPTTSFITTQDDPSSMVGFKGGGLTFWDGVGGQEIHYDTRCGDVAFIGRAVWHQADPITEGTRWALVIFYKVE